VINRGHLLPAELEGTYAPAENIVTAELAPGDCFFFHAALLHRSGVNQSDKPRRAINAILMPGQSIHTKRQMPYPVLFGKNQLDPVAVAALKAIPQ
jgi:ectoine hydroxylase-related dioxygenase (phytanoyl-CoA dioxygenase family)